MPSFLGVQVFGVSAYSRAVPHPQRAQWNAFPGVNGRERLGLGSDGGVVEFRFLATAADVADLGAYESTFRALVSGGATGLLVDTLGVPYPDAVAVAFAPAEEVEPDGFGGCSRVYDAAFEVL